MKLLPVFIILALCASPSLLRGDDGTALSQTDLDFITQAISLNKAEVRMAYIAADHHLMAPLQALAERMVTNHRAALKRLLALSRDKNAGLADEMLPGDLMLVEDLIGLADGEVPERFIKMRIEFLKRTIALCTTEIEVGTTSISRSTLPPPSCTAHGSGRRPGPGSEALRSRPDPRRHRGGGVPPGGGRAAGQARAAARRPAILRLLSAAAWAADPVRPTSPRMVGAAGRWSALLAMGP